MSLPIQLVAQATRYTTAEKAMLDAVGKDFFEGRGELRTSYAELRNPLTALQTQTILKALSSLSETIQEEADLRLAEWANKRRDGKLHSSAARPTNVAVFSKSFIDFYTKKTEGLNSQAYKDFQQVRDEVRDVFVSLYKQGTSPEEVRQVLEQAQNIDRFFIKRATEEWLWKSAK